MRFFTWFSAAFVWAITVMGVAAWIIAEIDPDRLDVGIGDMAATLVVLAVSGVLAFGGFILAADAINRH